MRQTLDGFERMLNGVLGWMCTCFGDGKWRMNRLSNEEID